MILYCFTAVGAVEGHPVYRTGKVASQCTTGKMPGFNGLCCAYEQYDHNYPNSANSENIEKIFKQMLKN